MKFLIIILSLYTLFSFTNAISYTLKGAPPCSDILRAVDEQITIEIWTHKYFMNGYVSGANMMHEVAGGHGDFGKNTDADAIYYSVVKYCRDNPFGHMAEAIRYMIPKLE